MNNMTDMKKSSLRGAFALLAAGYVFATPASATLVDYSISNSTDVVGIGDTTGEPNALYDALRLINPQTGQQDLQRGVPSAILVLGTLQFAVGSNCGISGCATGPLFSNNSPGGPAPLTFQFDATINSTTLHQSVQLNYTWTADVDPNDNTNKLGAHLVFSDFAITPIILDFGFERLRIAWQLPDSLNVNDLNNSDLSPTTPLRAILTLLPEPASLPMFGLGMMVAMGARMRRRAAA